MIKVKFDALSYNTGAKISITRKIESPEFVDIPVPEKKFKSCTVPAWTNTAFDQADKWLEGEKEYLQNLIYDEDLLHICSWEILEVSGVRKEQPKKQQIADILIQAKNDLGLSEEFINDFNHTYLKMRAAVKGLSVERQIEIIGAAMGVGRAAAIKALTDIIKMFDGIEEQKLIEN